MNAQDIQTAEQAQARRFITDTTSIFFCDFDGTLVNSQKVITPATREALDDFAARGNIFVFSSGRAMCDVRDIAERLGLHYPHMYLSAYNGAELYSCDTEKTFFRETLPLEAVKRCFELAHQYGLYCQTYDTDALIVEKVTKETQYYMRTMRMPVITAKKPWEALSAPPCKCLVLELDDPQGKIPPFRKALESEWGPARVQEEAGSGVQVHHEPTLHCLMSNAYYLEIDPIRASKGNALRWLCRYLGIDIRRSYAAGDAPNDVPMIVAAGTGIAMRNGVVSHDPAQPADPSLARAADVITDDDNDHDGLAPLIRRM